MKNKLKFNSNKSLVKLARDTIAASNYNYIFIINSKTQYIDS